MTDQPQQPQQPPPEEPRQERRHDRHVYDRRHYGGYGAYGGYGGYGMDYYSALYGQPGHGHHNMFSVAWMLRLLRRKWRIVAGIAIVVTLAALVHAMMTPKQYRAASTIEMSVRRPRVMDGNEAVLEERISLYRTDEVFNTRLEKFRGKDTREMAKDILAAQEGTNMVLPVADFSLVKDSFLVSIACGSGDPKSAAAGANAYAEAVIQVMANENQQLSDNAVRWLESQAESRKKDLERAEKTIADFRAKHNLDLLENQKASLKETLGGLARAVTTVRAQLVKTRQLYAALQRGESPDTVSESEGISDQLASLRQARVDEKALLRRYKDEHPKVVAAREQIQLLEKSLLASIREAVTLLEKQIDGFEKETAQHEHAATENEEKMVRLRSDLAALERERSVADMSYQSVLRRMEEARTSSDENTVAVKVVTRADPPKRPFSPKPARSTLLGFILGLILGFALAFAQDFFEDHVSATEDIEDGLGLKVLGVLPEVAAPAERPHVALSTAKHMNHELVEAIAGVRASIFSGVENPPKTILISSAGVQCGKTIVACNLASMLARTGQKTLLVDLDIRRPRVARIFSLKLDKKQSLAHVLAQGRTDGYESLVNKTEVERLEVVGNVADSKSTPTEIIGGKPMQAFLKWAAASYDNIVIDSPPHGLMSDALVLAGHVDGVLLVCRHEKSRKRAIRHALRQMNHVGDNLLGIVVNAAPLGGGPFSKYDYYYGSYSHKDYETPNTDDRDEG